jgi:hypothetical protein
MKKAGLMFILFAGIASGVMAQKSKNKKEKEVAVPYTVANRYFVNNTIADGAFVLPKITTQTEFDKLFGMATVMGKDGQPTPIDFEKQYVIAVIDAVINKSVSLSVKSLTEKKGTITLTYERTESGEASSAYFRHCLIVIVDNKYTGEIEVKNTQGEELIPYKIAQRYFVKNTVKPGSFTVEVTTVEEFDNIFGMATVMGVDGAPTPIDFSKQYIIGFVNESTNDAVEWTFKSFVKKGGELVLIYSKKGGENPGDAMRYCTVLIVDKKYSGKVKIEQAK